MMQEIFLLILLCLSIRFLFVVRRKGVKCDGFGINCNSRNAKRRRQKTSYYNDELNFMNLCKKCQKEADLYWEEKWKEHWSEVL